ncbi:hypothetical protein [Sutcliffiella sp. FSL R7-0096]|uniref:hypothetical protein n=1 Tax=Sutcliffiella sp. FSL R7-0096 TaxID=2921670 RepID=UPI00315A6220
MVFMIIAGCSNDIKAGVEGEHTIEVQRHLGDKNKYEFFKVVTDEEEVINVKCLLDRLNWQNAKYLWSVLLIIGFLSLIQRPKSSYMNLGKPR